MTENTDNLFNASTHNGYITILNTKTLGHRTFRIWTAKKGGLQGKRVVSMLTGPNREDYTNWNGFGFATETGVRPWKKFEGTKFAQFARILNETGKGQAYGLTYEFSTRCRVCNRELTNPVAIQLGIGPECGAHGNSKKMLKQAAEETL